MCSRRRASSGALRVVHTSTSEVYGTALTMPISESHPLQGQSPYSASKIGADMMAEAFARSFELPVAILRPFNTFGPRQSERAIIPTIIRQALDPTCNAIRTGDTSPLRDFTFVEDTAEAFLAIGIAPNIQFGRPYNAGSGKAVSVKDIIDLVMQGHAIASARSSPGSETNAPLGFRGARPSRRQPTPQRGHGLAPPYRPA